MTNWSLYGHQWDSRSWLAWRSFISSILQEVSSPGQTDTWGFTPVDLMIRNISHMEGDSRQMGIDTCSDMLKLGGYISSSFSVLETGITRSDRVFLRKFHLQFGYWEPKEFSCLNVVWKLADEKEIWGKYRLARYKRKRDLTLL